MSSVLFSHILSVYLYSGFVATIYLKTSSAQVRTCCYKCRTDIQNVHEEIQPVSGGSNETQNLLNELLFSFTVKLIVWADEKLQRAQDFVFTVFICVSFVYLFVFVYSVFICIYFVFILCFFIVYFVFVFICVSFAFMFVFLLCLLVFTLCLCVFVFTLCLFLSILCFFVYFMFIFVYFVFLCVSSVFICVYFVFIFVYFVFNCVQLCPRWCLSCQSVNTNM